MEDGFIEDFVYAAYRSVVNDDEVSIRLLESVSDAGIDSDRITQYVGEEGATLASIWLVEGKELDIGEWWRLCDTGSAGELVSAGAATLLTVQGDNRISAPYLLPVPYGVVGDDLEELDRWYIEEHADMLLKCPDWLSVRRYAVTSVAGDFWNRLVFHDLTISKIFDAPEVIASMATPWRTSLAQRPWFFAGGRSVLRRVVP